MAMHMLEGLALGMRASQAMVGQRERLLSLGRLSAGLTHELNNPAAAAVRATATLRERVSKMRRKLAHLATADIDPEALVALTELQEVAVERMAKAEKLTPMQVGEAEDELTDWLDDHGIDNGWDLAPALVAAGVKTDWLDEIADSLPRSPAGRRHPLGGLRAGDRAADGRDRGLDRPDLHPGRRGQAVLADGPGRPPGHRRPRRAEQHPGDARPQDQGVGPDHAWSRSTRRTCRWCPPTPPS